MARGISTNGRTAQGRRVYVETPRGRIVEVRHRDSTISMELKWNTGFSTRANKSFNNVQGYIDNAVIRYMTPYTPMRNGVLYKSATLGTTIGSGWINQVAPYARYLYYGEVYGPNIPVFDANGDVVRFWSPPKKHPTGRALKYNTDKHPLAGKKWFERMKADKKEIIFNGAKKYLDR